VGRVFVGFYAEASQMDIKEIENIT